jgi:hypothetical protein
MVQPPTVRTRAATQGPIRYGANYRGEKESTRNSFKYRAQRYYSRIPLQIKTLPLSTFKIKLKQFSFRNIPVR